MDINDLSGTTVVECPYNPSHKISISRIQIHLVKCEKQYPEDYRVICPYNATHRFSKEEITEHVLTCPMRRHMRPELYQKTKNCGSIKQYQPSEADSCLIESWDDDCDTSFYRSESNYCSRSESGDKSARPPRGHCAAAMIEPSESGSVIDDSASVISSMGMGRGTRKALKERYLKQVARGRGMPIQSDQ